MTVNVDLQNLETTTAYKACAEQKWASKWHRGVNNGALYFGVEENTYNFNAN
jgi:hypothetical protein